VGLASEANKVSGCPPRVCLPANHASTTSTTATLITIYKSPFVLWQSGKFQFTAWPGLAVMVHVFSRDAAVQTKNAV